MRGRHGPAQNGADAGQQLFVVERPDQEVVAAAVERTDAIDSVGLGLAEHDHRYIAVTGAVFVQGVGVAEQHEIRLRLPVHDPEAVVLQVPLEKDTSVELRLGEQ